MLRLAGRNVLAASLFLVAASTASLAGYGELDTSYGTNGVASIGFAELRAMAAQPDGKVIVAGVTGSAQAFVRRLHASGSTDLAFATNGQAVFTGPTPGLAIHSADAVRVQADGRIVIGLRGLLGYEPVFITVRLHADGSMDSSWGGSGMVYGPSGAGHDLWDVALQPDGNVLALGYENVEIVPGSGTTRRRIRIHRYTTSGQLDTSFGVGGVFAFDRPENNSDFARKLVLAPSGRIYAVGVGPAGIRILALHSTGWLDSSWGGAGVVDTPFGDGNGRGATLTSDGAALVVVGICGAVSCIERYNLNGAIDTTFGQSGRATFSIAPGGAPLADSVHALPGGDLLVAGDAWPNFADVLPYGQLLDASGNQDPAYNGSGLNVISTAPMNVRASALLPGNALLLAGWRTRPGTATQDIFLVRLHGDLVPPDTALTSGPSGTVGSNSATFTFTSDEMGATFECRLDGGAYAPCSSPHDITGLAQGLHVLEVRAVDGVGNVDASPATGAWTVDTVTPDTTITSGPAGTTAQATAAFTFTSDDPSATFQCSLDGAAWAACTSGVSYTGLADGMHMFEVRAVDGAGNADPTPAARSWAVDTASPNTTITSGPQAVTSETSATIAFTATEGGTFVCKLDAAAEAPCSSPATFTSLAAGSHSFSVHAVDAAGNPDVSPATWSWFIDVTAPDTAITSAPSGTLATGSATIAFSSDDATAAFECAMDGSEFTACASPVNLSGLADGPHGFIVRAKDAAGNIDTSPPAVFWTVDTTAPDTSISAAPPAASNSTSASFSFESNESGGTFECMLDAGAYTPCTSPKAYSGLAQGSHTFSVRARDAAGNQDASSAAHAWTIDGVAPNTTIASGPSGGNNNNPVTFTFTASEGGATFECGMDNAAFAACASGVTYSGLAKGQHTFQVRARDAAGNVDPSPASRSFGIK
jgi:uncharacterized delta-60 repeat protein